MTLPNTESDVGVNDIVTDPQHPGWRAVMVRDLDAEQPWGDAFAPALLIDARARVALAREVFQTRHGRRLTAAYERLADPELFDRYLRQYHGVTTIDTVIGRDLTVLVFDTADYRAHAGLTGITDLRGDCSDWQAWLDGEVYGIIVQRLIPAHGCLACGRTDAARWTDVDACWGFYGYAYAAARAAELLRDATTPLGRAGGGR